MLYSRRTQQTLQEPARRDLGEARGGQASYYGECGDIGIVSSIWRIRIYLKANRGDAAKVIGNITEDGIKIIIGRLQQLGLLKREGGRKNGIWVVMDR